MLTSYESSSSVSIKTWMLISSTLPYKHHRLRNDWNKFLMCGSAFGVRLNFEVKCLDTKFVLKHCLICTKFVKMSKNGLSFFAIKNILTWYFILLNGCFANVLFDYYLKNYLLYLYCKVIMIIYLFWISFVKI